MRYNPPHVIQRAVNLQAAGLSTCRIAREMRVPRGTVQGWLMTNGVASRMGLTPNIEKEVVHDTPHIVRVRVPASSDPAGAVTKVLAIGDAHDDPETEKDRFLWMGKLAADRGVDWIIQIGDFASMDSVSSHIPNDSITGKLKNPFTRDIQSLKEALGSLDAGLGSHRVQKHVTLGNHERRVWLYEEQRPEVAGMLTSELSLTFAEKQWNTSPYGRYFFLHGVGFTHAAINRLGKTYGGKNAENTIANDAVFDHVVGHSHVKRDVRAPKLGPSKHVTVLNLGCALPEGRVESYVYHGALTGWWWGVVVLTIQGGQIRGADAVPMSELQRMYG